MKTKLTLQMKFIYSNRWRAMAHAVRNTLLGIAACATVMLATNLRADETCSSPDLARIEGQEEFVYVWTLGVEGLGDGADKLVTLGVKTLLLEEKQITVNNPPPNP